MENLTTESLRQRFEPILASLAQRWGIGAVDLEESGHFGFTSDTGETIHCQLVERTWSDSLELSISLAEVTPETATEAFRLLLECNFAMYGSRDGWVALRPGLDELWYAQRLGLERMTGETLEAALADFLETVDYLRAMLSPPPPTELSGGKDMGLRA